MMSQQLLSNNFREQAGRPCVSMLNFQKKNSFTLISFLFKRLIFQSIFKMYKDIFHNFLHVHFKYIFIKLFRNDYTEIIKK